METRPAFVAAQRRLLALEREAERATASRLLQECSDAELVARGTTLLKLAVADLEPAVGGGVQAVLRPARGGELPAHRLSPGDLVALAAGRGETAVRGVVARVRRDALWIALDDEEAELPPTVRVDRQGSDVTWQRLDAAMVELLADPAPPRRRLVEVLLGERDPEFAPARAETIAWFDPDLDAAQREAVAHALAAEHAALLHGPPGTGKTRTLVEFVRQAVARGRRVLATAPSNVAVDNLAERLSAAGVRIVRLGHPARVREEVRDDSLAAQLDGLAEQKVLRDVRRDVEQGLRRLHRAKDRAGRRAARDEVKALRRELQKLEGALIRGIVTGAEVVLATNVGAADPLLREIAFDTAVIDEAAQALEAACWIPIARARRVVLAGDHRQLPPTILSAEAARLGLACTMFERLADGPHGGAMTRMLDTQYRMHAAIMAWPARRFYGDRLRAAPAVAGHLLTDLPEVLPDRWTSVPLVFVDTAGAGFEETAGDEDGSKANAGEVALVVRIVTDLRDAGVPAAAIAVVTPYNAQVQQLRLALAGMELAEVGTVDGLQGREAEAVVFSCVRSNENCTVGFLREPRRLNVALTRARRMLVVIGDSATLAADPDLLALVEHLEPHHLSSFEL